MLINLLMNGLQAMPEQGQLSVLLDTKNAGVVQIEVEDSGIGIPEENCLQLSIPDKEDLDTRLKKGITG